ncbi:bestrophin-2 isoform X2 [Chironomus tepperi]|uniref:bestrophin-2 isoform X2 n=1 Tax=Chironomus tepperi TaxID=113505 RepID=UPI00391FBD07
MTISYSAEVPNGSAFGCFWKILWKWRGSVYKLVWRELLAYLGLYYSINFIYRYALDHDQKRYFQKVSGYVYDNFSVFEKVRLYFGAQSESIPMSFVLGFYVSLVVKRWWEQYKLLPWPDTLALFISAAIPGNELGRLMRRNIMRYMVLAYVITLQRISLRVKRRFPGLQHLVDSGLMLESEKKIFEIMDSKSPMSKYWMPLVWSTNIINRARKDGLITSDHIVQTILMELSDIRRRLGALIGYDTVSVPLVYTQVVTLVLYTYFIAALMGRQMVPAQDTADGKKYEDPDLYFPLFTALQFCFYVGWLKVAEVLINPFGEDDDDIELNWLIDRHIKASYMIVDEMHEEHPELLKDQYWEEVVPKELPYTVASEHYRRHEPKGSAETYKVKEADAVYANIMPHKRSLNDDVYADYESVDTPMVERRKNWFSRQMHRMGSLRSSSTAYSSGGIFNRNRLNSEVYSSPEAGLTPHHLHHPTGKISRKSGRNRQLFKQNSKGNILNGQMVPRVRERVPTPENDSHRMNINSTSNNNPFTLPSISSSVALATSQLATNPTIFPSNNNSVPILGTLLLSPIKESDSVNNTLSSGSLATMTSNKSILPLNITSTNAQFGSQFVIPANSNQDLENFVMIPTTTTITQNENELIPVHTVPLAITTTASQTSAVITEFPVDHTDSVRSRGTTPRLENLFGDVTASPALKNKIERQQSLDSENVTTNVDNNSNSSNSTLSRRPAKVNGKNGEVYV